MAPSRLDGGAAVIKRSELMSGLTGAETPQRVDALMIAAVLAPTTLLLVLVSFDIETPLRAFLALWFFLLCPGLPIVRMIRFRSLTEQLLLAIVASIALDMLVAGVLLYADVWTAKATFYALASMSYIGLLISLMLPMLRAR